MLFRVRVTGHGDGLSAARVTVQGAGVDKSCDGSQSNLCVRKVQCGLGVVY